MKAYNLQMSSVPNWQSNIEFVVEQLKLANIEADSLVVLPECFAYFGGKDTCNLRLAQSDELLQLQQELAKIAKTFGIYLVCGSVPTPTQSASHYGNTCFVFSPSGNKLAEYQKIHLFDVVVADGTRSYRESDMTASGNELVYFDWCGKKVGIAICYDLRFPGLFQQLRDGGAEVVVLPSAFTQKTGEAHWHTLLTARAIENQYFVVACDQVGEHQNGRRTFGHSLIVDPWGRVLSDAKQQVGTFGAELKFSVLEQVRRDMPVAVHNRFPSRLTALN